ncbi:hypothetical protein LEMLEM_LOCUS22583 [Lemmus lemmus]
MCRIVKEKTRSSGFFKRVYQ